MAFEGLSERLQGITRKLKGKARITETDLKEVLSCHRHTARKFISDMLKVRLEDDEAIIGFWRTDYDEGLSKVIVNPKVFYGGNFNIAGGRQEILRWFERK